MWQLVLLQLALCGPYLISCAPNTRDKHHAGTTVDDNRKPVIHLATVACESEVYVEEAIMLLKSAMIFAQTQIHLHIFIDDHLKKEFTKQSLLPNEDFVIFVDTDIIFLKPIDDLFQLLVGFNSSQIAGLVPEHEVATISWYARFSRIPYVPPMGVNSGLILMNLTRMRATAWQSKILQYHKTYGEDANNLTWHDQDLINILFHFHPEMLYQFPCEWNYRPDHCVYRSVCKTAEENGVYLVHGNRQAFHNEKQPIFKAVYNAIQQFRFGSAMTENLTEWLEGHFQAYPSPAKDHECWKHKALFTKHLSLVKDGRIKNDVDLKSKVEL